MAEEATIEQPVQQPQGGVPPPYIDRVYSALKDNLQGFNKTPEEFKVSMQDSNYAAKAYAALKDNLTGFNKTPDDFYSQVGIKKKSITTGGAPTSPQLPTGGIPDQSFQAPTENITPLSPQAHQQQAQQRQAQSDQLQGNLNAYSAAQGGNLQAPEQSPSQVKAYKEPTIGQKAAFELKSIAGSLSKGVANMTIAPLYEAGNKVGLVSDEEKARVLNEVSDSDKETFGLDPHNLQHGDNMVHNAINQFAYMAPALITAPGTGGVSFGLQTAGQAATAVQKMKDSGVKFDNHSDDLFIYGSGIIGTVLGRGSMGTIFNSMGSGTKANITSALTAEVINGLGDKAEKATADDIMQAFLAKASTWSDKAIQGGLNYVKQYAKVGTELSAANAATFGTKKLANAVSGNEPFNDTTGQDFVQGVEEPFGLDKGAQGNPLTALANIATSPAGVFGAMGAGSEALGLIGNKAPIIESLQNDNSPENVSAVKQQLAQTGQAKGWNEQEIANSGKGVDLLSSTVGKLPKNLSPEKMQKGVSLVMGQDELQNQLTELQQQRSQLHPSVADVVSPQEQLIQDKIDQANDKLKALVTGNRPTYSKGTEVNVEEGQYFKTVNGVKEEITPQRYELESMEREVKANANKNEPQTEPTVENGVPETPKEIPAEKVNEEPTTNIGEQDNAAKIEGTGKMDVGEPSGNGETVGEGHSEQGEPAGESEPQQSSSSSNAQQKAIDAVTHGIVVPENIMGRDPSARFDFGMDSRDKQKAVRDIKNGNYETEPAKKMLAKLQEWDKNDEYPIIEGLGGASKRAKYATAEEIQHNIDDAKANKIGELSPRQIEEVNKPLSELGFTNKDFEDYENHRAETERGNTGATASIANDVQQAENDNAASPTQDTSSTATQGSEPKIADKAKELADRIRSLKSDKTILHGGLEGVGVAVWDGALETIATTIEAGGKLADAIQEGVKHILNHHPELDAETVGKKLDEDINGVSEEPKGNEEPKDKEDGSEVKKTILTKRAYEGGISDDVKKYLEEKGLTRKSFSQEERSKQATDFIAKFGNDAAHIAVENGDIDGGMAASVLAQLQIRNSRAMAEFPEGSDERDELAKKQADLISLMEKKGYLGGEFNGQLAHEYENAELDYANVKRQVEKLTNKPLTEGQEKKVKDLTSENEKLKTQLQESEAKLIDETDKAFKEGKEVAKNESKTEKAKRVANKLRENAKISRPGVFLSASPATLVWDAAIEVTAKSIEAGGKLADAVDAGIEHIKSTDWYKSLSENKKTIAEKEFKRFSNDNSGSTDLNDLQERFVDKTDNKFTTNEARDIWGYMKNQYLESGTSYKDALSKTADDLGLSWRQVSEAIITPKLKRASDEMWKRQADLARNRAGIKNWIGDQNKSVLGKALQKVSGIFRGVAVFGHGGIFVGTHAGMTVFNPSMWNKTIPAFFRGWKFAYGNEGAYQRSIEELKSSPNYLIAQRAGLKNNPERVNTEEYQKSQKYLGKLALAGEKGFNAIKVLRQDLFDYHFNRLTASERDDPSVAKSIAHIVNLATGATNVKIPNWVNEASFAGGMEAARWEKLTASPVKATQVALNAIFNPSKATTADRVFAKVWARRVGEQLATYSAALLANAAIQNTVNPTNKVNLTDPDKPDFLKFKFGSVTIDPTSGMRSTAMFMYKLGQIPFESKKELHGDKRISVVGKDLAGYARGKLAPLYSTGADFFTGQDFTGNVMPYSGDKPSKAAHKLTWGEYAWSKAPLPVAEAANVAYKSAMEHGAHKVTLDHVLNGIMSGAISGTTGFRVGEYDASAPENKKKH